MITHAILANAAGTQYIGNGSCQGHYTCYSTLDSIGKGSWYETGMFLIPWNTKATNDYLIMIYLCNSNGREACRDADGIIGNYSCDGVYACYSLYSKFDTFFLHVFWLSNLRNTPLTPFDQYVSDDVGDKSW